MKVKLLAQEHNTLMCGSRKKSIPRPPWKVTGNFQRGGGFKPRNFRGVEGDHNQLLFQTASKKHETNDHFGFLDPPPHQNFFLTLHGVGMDIFWNCTI